MEKIHDAAKYFRKELDKYIAAPDKLRYVSENCFRLYFLRHEFLETGQELVNSRPRKNYSQEKLNFIQDTLNAFQRDFIDDIASLTPQMWQMIDDYTDNNKYQDEDGFDVYFIPFWLIPKQEQIDCANFISQVEKFGNTNANRDRVRTFAKDGEYSIYPLAVSDPDFIEQLHDIYETAEYFMNIIKPTADQYGENIKALRQWFSRDGDGPAEDQILMEYERRLKNSALVWCSAKPLPGYMQVFKPYFDYWEKYSHILQNDAARTATNNEMYRGYLDSFINGDSTDKMLLKHFDEVNVNSNDKNYLSDRQQEKLALLGITPEKYHKLMELRRRAFQDDDNISFTEIEREKERKTLIDNKEKMIREKRLAYLDAERNKKAKKETHQNNMARKKQE